MRPLDKVHESWKPLIPDLLKAYPELQELDLMLYSEKVFPEKENIFNVFQMPLQDIKVVILGQDPYPKEGQAIGYAFAVNEGVNKPASLRIIEKEVGNELDRTLQNWRDQGVFLLNTALTVRAGQAGSHTKYWTNFTQSVISYISKQTKCIWLLWGKNAQSYKPFIHPTRCIHRPGLDIPMYSDCNYVLISPHPAAEAYTPGAGFIGNGHFKAVNSILKGQGKQQISW